MPSWSNAAVPENGGPGSLSHSWDVSSIRCRCRSPMQRGAGEEENWRFRFTGRVLVGMRRARLAEFFACAGSVQLPVGQAEPSAIMSKAADILGARSAVDAAAPAVPRARGSDVARSTMTLQTDSRPGIRV